MKRQNWDDLKKRVSKSETGFVTVSAGELRRMAGFRKLGRFVAAAVQEKLEENGLGYFPEIPRQSPRSGMPVRVFKLGGRVEVAIKAASRVDPESDKTLASLVLDHSDGLEAVAELEQIRKIVSRQEVAA